MVSKQPAFNFHQEPQVNPFDAYAKNMAANMNRALANQDGARFAESCLALGITGDQNPDPLLFTRGLADLQFEESSRPKIKTTIVSKPALNRYEKADRTAERYTKLLELNASYEVIPGDMFNRPNDKREILMKAGYKSLFVSGGHSIPLIDACNERIGATYQRMYASARKWKAKQKDKDKDKVEAGR